MLTVSTELQPILNGILQFISYMVLAVFAENVILARALGVTRLMKLVPDHRAQVWDFCLPLLLVITVVTVVALYWFFGTERGCSVRATGANANMARAQGINTGANIVLGLMLSNGPGDPTDNVDQIAEIAKLFGRIPMFGICLGHQLMALAQGGSTVKLKYGHRGVNQPARDVCGTRTFLTSQNHGYAVVPESVKTGVIRYINANDGTCEGVDYPDLRAFSVQFHPEACSGPHDTAFLFDRFCDLMGGAHHAD